MERTVSPGMKGPVCRKVWDPDASPFLETYRVWQGEGFPFRCGYILGISSTQREATGVNSISWLKNKWTNNYNIQLLTYIFELLNLHNKFSNLDPCDPWPNFLHCPSHVPSRSPGEKRHVEFHRPFWIVVISAPGVSWIDRCYSHLDQNLERNNIVFTARVGKVMFLQVSVRSHAGGGGGWYPSHRFFPRFLVPGPFWGYTNPGGGGGVIQSQVGGSQVPQSWLGYPRTGYPPPQPGLNWGTTLAGTGVPPSWQQRIQKGHWRI